jgi:hypothetical protein
MAAGRVSALTANAHSDAVTKRPFMVRKIGKRRLQFRSRSEGSYPRSVVSERKDEFEKRRKGEIEIGGLSGSVQPHFRGLPEREISVTAHRNLSIFSFRRGSQKGSRANGCGCLAPMQPGNSACLDKRSCCAALLDFLEKEIRIERSAGCCSRIIFGTRKF